MAIEGDSMLGMRRERLFQALIPEYLFVSLFRAFAGEREREPPRIDTSRHKSPSEISKSSSIR